MGTLLLTFLFWKFSFYCLISTYCLRLSGSFLFNNDQAAGCYGGVPNLEAVSVPSVGWTYIRRWSRCSDWTI